MSGCAGGAKKTSGPRSTTGFLKVIDTLAVGNGRTIHLVALGDRVIAIGATAQQLSFLSELTGTSRPSCSITATQPDQPLAAFASELFQSMRGNRSKSFAPRPLAHDRRRLSPASPRTTVPPRAERDVAVRRRGSPHIQGFAGRRKE